MRHTITLVSPILNISAYKFVELDDASAMRQPLLDWALELGLKGTVLLAPEGINLFLAGPKASVRSWLGRLRADPRLADLQAKESSSDRPPFRRMVVKVKREIIRMNQATIRPAQGRAPAVAPATAASARTGSSRSSAIWMALRAAPLRI